MTRMLLVLGSGIFLVAGLVGCGSAPASVTFGDSSHLTTKKRLAVLPFSDAEGIGGANIFVGWSVQQNNGETVAGILAEALLGSGAYSVIERSRLKTILEEQGLSAAEFIERRGAKEVGRLLQADTIVVGTVGRFWQTGGLWWFADAAFSARCIDVETGELIWSASPSVVAFGSTTEYTKAMCKQIAAEIRQKREGASQ